MIQLFFTVVLFLVNITKILGDYCEFGTCEEDEYCCGSNKCCKKTTDIWYFWAGIFLIIITTLSSAYWLFRRKLISREQYHLIPQHDESRISILKNNEKSVSEEVAATFKV